jgi:hypothetical protein
MSKKADYTADEWQTIVKSPPMAGLAVTLASPNGPFGVMKEMFAVGMAIAETLQKGSSNELVSSLIEDLKARGTKPERPQGMDSPEKARAACMQALKDLDALLAAKSTPNEALGFKQWLLGIAQSVAEASNEGGFMGFGGEKVSAAEREALAAISATLHLS